ncbi:MAG TPA: hypothetical protein VJU82_14030 [Acidobacteriaceae bacterium]|nr:hypothetical protein [Acidobacteriaceae bacterium]
MDELLDFEKKPDLGGDDDHLRASWLASYAYTYGSLRDFSGATELMQQAHPLSPGDAWLHSLESDVLGTQIGGRKLATSQNGAAKPIRVLHGRF